MIHATTNKGYYRSTDGGENWTNTRLGEFTDIALNPLSANTLWATLANVGLMLSLNAGETWVSANDPLWSTNVSRGAVTVCAANPEVIYVAFAQPEEGGNAHVMEGVYKTANSGATWVEVTPNVNYMGGQAWYNNVIAISPTNPAMVLVGGVSMLRTNNGGLDWAEAFDDDLHVDYHALQWAPDGLQVWAGHDGGWSYSNNMGLSDSWISDGNVLPITQLSNVDVQGSDWTSASVGGGTQDNALAVSNDAGDSWHLRSGGDTGGFLIHPVSLSVMYASNSVFVVDHVEWPRIYSLDGGVSWFDGSTGISSPLTWYPSIRHDSNLNRLYTNDGAYIYSSTAYPLNWVKENISPFPAEAADVELSAPVIGGPRLIYVPLDSDQFRERLEVKENGFWDERSAGLPTGVPITKVVPHPSASHQAYALMAGYSIPDGKLFHTSNGGYTWVDITGDLPPVPLVDLVVHPEHDDRLYLGTEFGFYRSLNGGVNWSQWNAGIPKAVMASELKTFDTRVGGAGSFYIVAGTYGRSIWRRDVLASDPTGVAETAPSAKGLRILGAAPNPFNPATILSFELGLPARVELSIYDSRGRRLRRLLNEELSVGLHRIEWDGSDETGRMMSSGVYHAQIIAAGERGSWKLVLAK